MGKINKLNKKELKDFINTNGFFASALIDWETNAPGKYKSEIPEGATYFRAIASTGELNRNGYIIREKAWKKAIAQYMENPVILLQHDTDQPIGRVLNAKVSTEGLIIEGYVFDDLTENRFSKGLFNAVSTGHITEGIEFENEKTGEVMSEEAFRQLDWEEQESGNWIMAVTSLDWLENSIVSIGANRKSLIQAKDVVKNYINKLKNNPMHIKKNDTEVTEEEVKEEVQPEQAAQPVEEKAEEVAAPVDAPTENVDESKDSTVEVSAEEVKQVNSLLKTLAEAISARDTVINSMQESITDLRAKLDNIPMPLGVVAPKVEQQNGFLAQLFEQNGVKINK